MSLHRMVREKEKPLHDGIIQFRPDASFIIAREKLSSRFFFCLWRKFMLSQDYQDLKTINRSRFFIINGLLFRCSGLSKISFLFLENLIHLACQSKIKKDKDDFFLCTVSFLKNHSMPWTRNEQKRQIRKLIQMGYIETKTKASKDSFKTQYRWIKMNVENIKEKARTVLTTKKVIS